MDTCQNKQQLDTLAPSEQARDVFVARLCEITDRTLDARTIDTYADTALDNLVGLIDEVLHSTGIDRGSVAQERVAFAQVGLDPQTVDATLNRIMEVAERISELDSIVATKTQQLDAVIIPTDPERTPETLHGGASAESFKEEIPKLKTLLLLLDKGLNIDITSDDVRISKGSLRPGMMRSVSYDMVEVPELNRLVFSCDQLGNATFVFDAVICRELGIVADDLIGLTKEDLRDVISQDRRIGRVIRYSNRYTEKLADTLVAKSMSSDDEAHTELNNILGPKIELAPDGFMSARGIADKSGYGRKVVSRAIEELGESLGPVRDCRFGTRTCPGYSPEQQQQIVDSLGYLEPAPEGYLPVNGMAGQWNVANATISRAIDKIGEDLGPVAEYRFGSVIVPGYSLEQQQKIIDSLGYLVEPAPEGYLSVSGIARQWGVKNTTISRAIDKIGEDLGPVAEYRFVGAIAHGYSPEQHQKIVNSLNLSSPAPEGYLCVDTMASQWGTSSSTIKRAINKLGEDLGPIKIYRSKGTPGPGYSPGQQRLIAEWLNVNSTRVRLSEVALGLIDRG